MISGVGIISPLYSSQIFSAIPGEKYKGYVACIHFIALVLFVGYLMPASAQKDDASVRIEVNSGEVTPLDSKKIQ